MCLKKSVVFILPNFNVGGAERVTVNILKYLSRVDFNIKLIVIDSIGPLESEIPTDVEIVKLKNNRLRNSIFEIAIKLSKIKPDYIFTTLGHVNIAVLFINKFFRIKAKVIIRESSTPSKSLIELPKYKAFFQKVLIKLFYPIADTIVAQCDSMKNDLVEKFGIKSEKITRIYNPIIISEIKYKSEEFKPIEFCGSNINIVAVGRLVEAKGYDVLFQAIKKVVEIKPEIRLFIIGDGPLYKDLLSLKKQLDIDNEVNLLGFKSNPYPYMKNADLYVLSSRREGFPNTLLEALACNTKVVATDCESGPKEILLDERFGLLANVDDENSLFIKINDYISLENRSTNRAEDFEIRQIIVEYEDLFKR